MTPKVRQKLSGLFYPCAADDDEFIAVVALVAKATHSGEILDADKVVVIRELAHIPAFSLGKNALPAVDEQPPNLSG